MGDTLLLSRKNGFFPKAFELTAAGLLALLLTLAISILGIQVTVAAGNDDYSDWMGELATETHGKILDQTLAEFIFPGSHDAGAYNLTGFACESCGRGGIVETVQGACGDNPDAPPLAAPCSALVGGPTALAAFGIFAPWSQTQNLTIEHQLKAGARYFDLRFYRATNDDPLWFFGDSEAGKFYIHHTLAGPSSDVIFEEIAKFMENHPREIVILSLTHLREGSAILKEKNDPCPAGNWEESPAESKDGKFCTGMSDKSLDRFFEQLDVHLGKYMAEESLTDNGVPTLREVINSGRRLIVTSNVDEWATPMAESGLTEESRDEDNNMVMVPVPADRLIWPKIKNRDFWSVGNELANIYNEENKEKIKREEIERIAGGYPVADSWNTDAKLLGYMRKVAKRDSKDQMFAMGFQMGIDASATMVIRGYLCAVDVTNYLELCPALDDDWDSFVSLEDVANWTNSKTLPAIIALPRDSANIVVSDFYNSRFTDEVIKLNRGAVRVQTLIRSVSAINTIDFGSAADFYPIIKDDPTAWGQWGGAYLEIPNTNTINPKWLMVRSVPTSLENLDIAIQIWDEDDGLGDDLVDVSPLLRNSKLVQVSIQDCLRSDTCPSLTDVLRSSGKQGPADERAHLVYSVSACEWSTCIDDGLMPVASPTQSPDANDAGWNKTDVKVSWNWQAGTLGSELDPNSCPLASTERNEGTVSLEATCTDFNDNVGNATYTVQIDKTDPVSEPVQTPAANDLGWNNTDVELAWNWSDDISGIAGDDRCAPDSLSSGQGALTLETTCEDVADNEGNESYTVQVDTSDPVITVSQPAAVEYVHSATLTLDYNVTDSVSGVRTITPDMNAKSTLAGHGLQSGQSIDLLTELPLGPHTFTVNAVDNADNASAPEAVTFTIIVTAQSIIDAVNLFETRGEIGYSAVNSLLSKLSAARKKHERGQCRPAGNVYAAFINQLRAKSGKSITPKAAAILTGNAEYLISHCSK